MRHDSNKKLWQFRWVLNAVNKTFALNKWMVCASGIMKQVQCKVELIFVYLPSTQWINFL